jgi:hypothetical protein
MPSLLVYTPTFADRMHPECERTVRGQQTAPGVTWDWVVDRDDPFPYPDHRNVLAKYQRARQQALDGGYDALLTVEHDMALPLDAFLRLWATAAPVVFGVYQLRHGSGVINAWRYENKRNLGSSLTHYKRELLQARKRGAWRVCGCGWGCTLIRREVLERVPFHDQEGHNAAGDLAFAYDCIARDVLMLARFDVSCIHYEKGKALHPYESNVVMAPCEGLVNQRVLIAGHVWQLRPGQRYEFPEGAVAEWSRAGYVKAV